MIDPITAMTTISAGLKLVDEFRSLALRFRKKKDEEKSRGEIFNGGIDGEYVREVGKERRIVAEPEPSTTVEQSKDAIEIKVNGQVTERVKSTDIRLDGFEEERYNALEKRVKINWTLFHELYSQLPLLYPLEKAQIEIRMERIKNELCQDFREMVKIYNNVLGISLDDHYSLYKVCD